MTEKRFTMPYGKFRDNETGIEYDEKWESWKICELLNSLADENEQLKQQEKKLYEYFRKCFDNVSKQAFRETWEVVKNND